MSKILHGDAAGWLAMLSLRLENRARVLVSPNRLRIRLRASTYRVFLKHCICISQCRFRIHSSTSKRQTYKKINVARQENANNPLQGATCPSGLLGSSGWSSIINCLYFILHPIPKGQFMNFNKFVKYAAPYRSTLPGYRRMAVHWECMALDYLGR